MKRLLTILILVALLPAGSAHAGRNANGALIVHTNDAYNWSNQTVCTTPDGMPSTCQAANTRSDRDAGTVVWMLVSFPPTASPGVTVVYFGIDYNDTNLDPGVGTKLCGPAGSLEVPDDDWPYSGRGNSVAFGSPVYQTLFPYYAFRIDGGLMGAAFCSTINPTGGYAAFVDDSNPPVLDYVHDFGCVRWYQQGQNSCPCNGCTGACCFPDGSCAILLSQDECAAAGGAYQGDATTCDPNPCPQPPGACCFEDGSCFVMTFEECTAQGGQFMGEGVDCVQQCEVPPGACCLPDGTCFFTTEVDCLSYGGTFQGVGTLCEPNPCPQPGACCLPDGLCEIMLEADCTEAGGVLWVPGGDCQDDCPPTATVTTTWGRIRSIYR